MIQSPLSLGVRVLVRAEDREHVAVVLALTAFDVKVRFLEDKLNQEWLSYSPKAKPAPYTVEHCRWFAHAAFKQCARVEP